MGLFGKKYGEKAANKAAKELGLRPATDEEMYGAHAPLLAQVTAHRKAGRISEIGPLYAAAWATKERMSDGKPLYHRILSLVHDEPEDPAAIPTFLAPYRAAHESAPTVFTASVYCQALLSAAFEARGYDYAHNTSDSQWAAFRQLVDQAAEILMSARDVAGDDFAWWSARYQVTQVTDLGDASRADIFEKVWSLDRGNLSTIGQEMGMLLPRWHGTDAHEADRFARRAAELTADEWGAGAYAIAYTQYTDEEDLEASDTGFDPALAERGFQDMIARTTSVSVPNLYARTMSWANQEQAVLRIFDQGLTVIAPGAWDAEDDEFGVQRAGLAWLWAKNNV